MTIQTTAQAVHVGPLALIDGNSRAARGVAVTVKNSSGGLASVYNGPERRSVPNPSNSGFGGEFDAWLDPGEYTLSFVDPRDGSTVISKNLTVAANATGQWPIGHPVQALLGQLRNVVDSTYPARTNLEWGLGNPSDGALAATGVCAAVAVPVDAGATISKVGIPLGATAESGGSHAFVALYSGIAVPALIVQSADLTAAAAVAPASARFDFTLATPTEITAAMAPNGFIYVSISMTGTVATALSLAIPTAVGYQWTPNGPLFIAATHGSAVAGTAPATIASPAAKAVAPVVILT